MFRFLFEFLEMILAELRRWMDTNLRFEDPTAALVQELQLMYGGGEISADTYFQYREKALVGMIGRGELMLLRRQARERLRNGESGQPWRSSMEVNRGLKQVWINRARLADARAEAEAAIRRLEAGMPATVQAADRARTQAAAALPDEEAAYQHLEVQQKLLERSRALETRLRSLKATLGQIDALLAELDTYESELRAVDVQERISSLELNIREGLLFNR